MRAISITGRSSTRADPDTGVRARRLRRDGFLKGQSTPYSDSVLGRFAAGATPTVPTIWELEVANSILVAVRRGKIFGPDAEAALDRVADSGVVVDAGGSIRRVIAIARVCSVSSYDASYLEVAERLRLPLATKDGALEHAAGTMKIPIF